jgi:hypothetical protein
MQKLILCVLALLCLTLSRLSAQSSDLETQIASALSQLDTKPIQQSTGIWLDRVPQYIPIKRYKGTSINK